MPPKQAEYTDNRYPITLVWDPCEWPCAIGMRIPLEAVKSGIEFGSWLPGTIFHWRNSYYLVQSHHLAKVTAEYVASFLKQ